MNSTTGRDVKKRLHLYSALIPDSRQASHVNREARVNEQCNHGLAWPRPRTVARFFVMIMIKAIAQGECNVGMCAKTIVRPDVQRDR